MPFVWLLHDSPLHLVVVLTITMSVGVLLWFLETLLMVTLVFSRISRDRPIRKDLPEDIDMDLFQNGSKPPLWLTLLLFSQR
nr:CBM_HP1_G0007440.mRNA.1.CDS.1 [Saccharomyces cerevisiae]